MQFIIVTMDEYWKVLQDFRTLTDVSPKKTNNVEMTQEQQLAIDLVKKGKSVFLSGRAGSGKSFTITQIIEWAKKEKIKVGTTATTGASALLIGGQTIQSFLGIGSGSKNASEMTELLFSRPRKLHLLRTLQILIIDEISMMNATLFDKISQVLCNIRSNSKPFGGIQVILCGDFSQNCPIDEQFCFMANAWQDDYITPIFLKRFMRQNDDVEFQEILESIRYGKITKAILQKLEELKHTQFPDDIDPTILFSTNLKADAINDAKFKELVAKGAKSKTFEISTKGENGTGWAESSKIPDKIDLCIGAQVMITHNISIEEKLINGTRGEIVGFSPHPIIQIQGKTERVVIKPHTIKCENSPSDSIMFIPLKLAWALTIAKSQGCTLDYCVIDLASSVYGQAYTALSRVRSLNHIKIIGEIKANYFIASPEVIAFYNECFYES